MPTSNKRSLCVQEEAASVMELAAPPLGISEANSTDHAMCGRLAALAAMYAVGFTGNLAAPDNATAEQLAAAVNSHQGFHAVVKYDPVDQDIANALAAGAYPVVGVNCTPYAEPTANVTGIRHWVTAYSTTGKIHNSWRPSYEIIDVIACHKKTGMGTVIISGPGGSTAMTPAEKQLLGAAFLRLGVWDLGREGMTPDQQKAWLAAVQPMIDAENWDGVLAWFEDNASGEAQAWHAALRNTMASTKPLQDSVASLTAQVAALKAQIASSPPGGVSMDQVKAEIIKVLKAGEAGV